MQGKFRKVAPAHPNTVTNRDYPAESACLAGSTRLQRLWLGKTVVSLRVYLYLREIQQANS